MAVKMTKVEWCDAIECAYNIKNKCHAIAITIGGGVTPRCDTSIIGAKKGGVPDTTAYVGACKVENCRFNKSFECIAKEIQVKVYTILAECATFVAK